MAVGMTLVILTSGIDLSVGSLLALSAAIGPSLASSSRKGRIQVFIATMMMLFLRDVTVVRSTLFLPIMLICLVRYWSSTVEAYSSLDHSYSLYYLLVYAESHPSKMLYLRAGRTTNCR